MPLPVEAAAEPDASAVLWVAGQPTTTNSLLLSALIERGLGARLVKRAWLRRHARAGDVVLGRLDVRPTLDDVEDGLWDLRQAERSGTRVLNRAASLGACHDKLQTTLRLGRLGLPQPTTVHVDWETPPPGVEYPVVVKPRFGSWGKDVCCCQSDSDLRRCLEQLRSRCWFRRQGVLVQALVPPLGYDLRLVVARGRVVGAIKRVAAPGEWRTNIALGATRRPIDPSPEASGLAVAAAPAVGADLVGVDLLPLPGGGYVVLELNGAVDFTPEYSLGGVDVFQATASVIATTIAERTLADAGSG
jgi:[lysine-biosynthesis-protein LysW]--L-2-aminoadipate ligase